MGAVSASSSVIAMAMAGASRASAVAALRRPVGQDASHGGRGRTATGNSAVSRKGSMAEPLDARKACLASTAPARQGYTGAARRSLLADRCE